MEQKEVSLWVRGQSVPEVTPCRNNFGKISPKYLEYAEIFRIFAMSIRTNDI